MASSITRFLDHTQRRTTVGRTPLHEWSARRRDLYLTTHNTHNRQTFMPPTAFEPTVSAGERPQTYALDRAVTGTGIYLVHGVHLCAVYYSHNYHRFFPLNKINRLFFVRETLCFQRGKNWNSKYYLREFILRRTSRSDVPDMIGAMDRSDALQRTIFLFGSLRYQHRWSVFCLC